MPQPWIDVFLPARAADASRSLLTRPFVVMPDSDVVVIFGSLRFAAPDPALLATRLARNRVSFESERDRIRPDESS